MGETIIREGAHGACLQKRGQRALGALKSEQRVGGDRRSSFEEEEIQKSACPGARVFPGVRARGKGHE